MSESSKGQSGAQTDPHPHRSGLEELDLPRLHAFAASRGGECLSIEFLGVAVRHRWRCGRGHEFDASPRLLVMAGHWCDACFPSVENTDEWDYSVQIEHDPLLRRFHR
jgi:hypothetical protein